ncbi:MAG TPA: sigma-70 family RNA polymerase sigma factor [Tepidiformaceae bacterium]|nr:sigma-70 family RNA polymerase sigma factor [Tepidiformaceae bacterium]
MDELLAQQFEANRPHLRAVAYRMLGSLSDADDAVQDAWLRFSRADRSDVENVRAWLTTVVARVSLNMLQSRKTRREEPWDGHLPDPLVSVQDEADPEHEAILGDSIGLALMVVLEQLSPPERLAFVLHDIFGVSFDEIAPIVDRTPTAARQLASRARRRVQRGADIPDRDLTGQREVVEAFLAAAREGNFERLLEVLDPGVVLRNDYGTAVAAGPREVRGATAVANGAITFSRLRVGGTARIVLVNGAVGLIRVQDGRPVSLMAFTVAHGRLVEIDILHDPERLDRLNAVPTN